MARKRKQKITRYCTARVLNMDRLKGNKNHDIPVRKQDGTLVLIKDRATVEISEEIFNALNDAVVTDYYTEEEEGQKPRIEKYDRNRIDVQNLSGWYCKDEHGNLIEEEEKKEEKAKKAKRAR